MSTYVNCMTTTEVRHNREISMMIYINQGVRHVCIHGSHVISMTKFQDFSGIFIIFYQDHVSYFSSSLVSTAY